MKNTNYHSLPIEEVLTNLETSKDGLSKDQVEDRKEKYGVNVLPSGQKFTRLRIFFRQFNSPLTLIIIGAAIASFAVGHAADSIFILVVIFVNTTVGFIQESKAEKVLDKLKKTVQFNCKVFYL